MILVDTSVWVDHLRRGNADLSALLADGEVACHPFVIGELACGSIRNRREILLLLRDLPSVATIEQDEYLAFVDQHHLSGAGLGFVDIHLLASARLAGTPLWTTDRTLRQAADRLRTAFHAHD